MPHANELVFEVLARDGAIEHFLWVPQTVRSSVESILKGVIGSLRTNVAEKAPTETATLALRLFVPTPSVLADGSATEASLALLSGLAGLRECETVVVRWGLRPGAPRPRQQTEHKSPAESEIDRAWRRKTVTPGFSVSGLVLVRAPKVARARELAAHVDSVFRSRRGLVGEIRSTAGRGNRRLSAMPRTTRTSGWLTTAEILPLVAWPLGAESPPASRSAPRESCSSHEVFLVPGVGCSSGGTHSASGR